MERPITVTLDGLKRARAIVFAAFVENGFGFVSHAFVLKKIENGPWAYLDSAENDMLCNDTTVRPIEYWDETKFMSRSYLIEVYVS